MQRHVKDAKASIFQANKQIYLNDGQISQSKQIYLNEGNTSQSKQIYLNHSDISQSEGEELGMWRHVEDAKGGRDCGHNEDPQKQPGKRLVYRNNVCNI